MLCYVNSLMRVSRSTVTSNLVTLLDGINSRLHHS